MLPLCSSDFDIHILKHMCTHSNTYINAHLCLVKNWCVLKGYVLIHEGGLLNLFSTFGIFVWCDWFCFASYYAVTLPLWSISLDV